MKDFFCRFIIALSFFIPTLTQAQEVKINGLLQMWSVRSDTSSTFLLKRSEVALSGFIEPEKVSFALMVDPASVPSDIIQDLMISYAISPQASITVGQMLYPLTMEGLQPSAQLDFINRSIIGGREYGDKRDIGIRLAGKLNLLVYSLGVFNGAGANAADNNDSKDMAGRLVFEITRNIRLGGSGYYGPHNRLATDSSDVRRNRAGVEFAYEKGRVGLKSEIMWGRGGDMDNGGYYISGTYAPASKWQFAARFESWDSDLNASDDREYVTTLGLNYMIKGYAAKIMANYLIKGEEDMSGNSDEFYLQFQAAF